MADHNEAARRRRRRHVHECTDEEFDDLCDQASSLKSSPDEARRLLLDCARAGGSIENDSILALLRTFGDGNDRGKKPSDDGEGERQTAFVDSVDGGGNTALHRACANGHDLTASILIENGASFLRNGSGNTPLHWAAAAGHVDCVRVLLESYPSSQQDSSKDGVNGGAGVIDVLEKNGFGRSALTEGFASQNTEVVGLLLEHDSATEERLIGGGGGGGNGEVAKKEEVEDDGDIDVAAGVCDDDDDKEEDERRREKGSGGEGASDRGMSTAARRQYEEAARGGVVHEFDFRRTGTPGEGDDDDDALGKEDEHRGVSSSSSSGSVLIRELPIANADDPFGRGGDAAGDTTGFGIWAASLVLARWVSSEEMSSRFDGRTVLELGAGCGVPGIAAARYSNAKAVYVTDLNPATVENLRHNVDLNAGGTDDDDADAVGGRLPWRERVRALPIDWADESTWPTSSSRGDGKLDFVIGSDLIYQADVVPLVRRVVSGLLREDGGVFLYVAPNGGHRDGLAEFVREMKEESDVSFSESVAPDEYLVNPLRSGDEDDCFLHFHELGSTSYVLYEFRRCGHRRR